MQKKRKGGSSLPTPSCHQFSYLKQTYFHKRKIRKE